ncbi:putative acetyl/propionyl-CoA carboxylase (Beta subunit) accD6 [Mycobacterium xenopi 3993]|nr:putative acetyl/propionyl-CoA carboxylase (Beta subunit) accD6 [Mycobacterium xenopi 3993]
MELLHERDRSGCWPPRHRQRRADHRVLHRRHRDGRAMGVEGCAHIVDAYDTAVEEQCPIVGIWHSGGPGLPRAYVPCTRSGWCSRR